ncbi:MAG: hypothetical protein KZQ66_13180 [Candidatus Thiodiazotropha sp. (ex Lucinoma aequizonata)]|nr:hypothetical protein [Candidatus Thiodiazotropha sp. (ex Lucinoma aequizonata)]MCU7893651.1 hypothetical protein [Candidatus Thiodiazotropha sp. (ex Lucinoma aequizonata)]MCU7900295.1 hypothetical protein [Candidatus Thiodiazotropha sp. (ex Lucinoma aequizonata)]MCU7902828.1 hypothetical protein [Candidatus Thiodiazotropha sp. (ex Lucinoma aequizonata)]MCU7908044.1 hypothetical protein [Candidatus Thiodiazotropha sp. (ex Lucinoma aequizonata)]
MTAYCAPTVLGTSRFRIALPQQAARAVLHHDYRNDSTASRMRSLVCHSSLPFDRHSGHTTAPTPIRGLIAFAPLSMALSGRGF